MLRRMRAYAELLEGRRLFDGAAVDFGAGATSATATLSDGDGTVVTFTLAGPGSGTATAGDDGRLRVTLHGTTGTSTLTIKTDAGGGDGLAALGDIDVDGSLRTLAAKTSDLHGDLTAAAGAVRAVLLNTATGGGTITAAAGLGEVRTAGDLAADVRVPAGRVGTLAVGGNASGLTVRAARVDRIDVAGDLAGSKVLLFPPADYRGADGLGRMNVRGAMRGSRVNALGNVGAVSAGAMFDSDVVAGVRFNESAAEAGVFEPVLPSSKDVDFTGNYSVGNVTVSGDAADAGGFAYANSRVAAYRVGGVTLTGVNPENGGRLFGVSGYVVKSVQRRFGGPNGATLSRQESPRTNTFWVHQIYEKLVFRPGTGTYTGVSYGAVINTSYFDYSGIWSGSRTFDVPADGIQVGTISNHPSATMVVLNPDGSYDAADAQGNRVARAATAGALAAAVAGVSGTSMKVVYIAVTTGTATTTYAPGSISFLSTSVGPEVKLVLQGESYFRNAAGTNYQLPTVSQAVSQVEAAGLPVQLFTRPLLKMLDAPVLIGRRFDDDRGALEVVLSPDMTLSLRGPAGLVEQAGSNVTAALMGDPAQLGRGRRNISATTGARGLVVSGLGDGGTAVLYAREEAAIDARGATLLLPSLSNIYTELRAVGAPS